MFPRPIDKVIDAVVIQIPEGGYEAFRKELEVVKMDAFNRAPEAMRISWKELMDTCQNRLGPPDTPWKMMISDIITAKIDYSDVLKNVGKKCLE